VEDIKARAEHDAKKNGKWWAFGIDVKLTMRRVERESRVIAASLSDAASAAIKTWLLINEEIIQPAIEAEGGAHRQDPKTVAWTE